jgi:hypothetical protein
MAATMDTAKGELITDGMRLVGAKTAGGYDIRTYDDGFGPLWVHRNSLGVDGIVRAQTWEDAYSICEDEIFPEADETMDELVKEYGFRVEHKKVVRAKESIPEAERPSQLGEHEKFAEPSDYTDNGRLPEGAFLRWVTIETPDENAWIENPGFCESYGFRNNGANDRDKLNHGIYAKDLNGDSLDRLTVEMVADWGIRLEVETDE